MRKPSPIFRVRWTLQLRGPLMMPPLPHAVLYALLCETNRDDGKPQLPSNLLLDAPERSRPEMEAGECYSFGATLVDADPQQGSRRLWAITEALAQLGQTVPAKPVHLGGNFDLVEVRDCAWNRNLQPGEAFQPLSMLTMMLESLHLQSPTVTLHFHSPLRLARPNSEARPGHEYADADWFHAGQLLRAVQKRVMALGLMPADQPTFEDSAIALRRNRLHWLDLEYGNSDRRRALGGALGRVELLVPDAKAREALVWGQYARVGSNVNFGFGNYRIEELGPDEHACDRAVPLLHAALRDADLPNAIAISKAPEQATLEAAAAARDGDYSPAPLQALTITDPDGQPRRLGIPIARDRALQRAILGRLSRPVDLLLEASSFAWRRGFSRESAAKRIQRLYREGWAYAVHADFDRFFDSISLTLLADRLEAWLGDRATTELILRLLAPSADFAAPPPRALPDGLPTGAPLSPLLANLLLDHFDESVRRAGGELVRYADDFLILTHTIAEAEQMLALAHHLAGSLQLRLNDDAKILDLGEPFRFLGFDFQEQGTWQLQSSDGPVEVPDLGWRQARREPPTLHPPLPGESEPPPPIRAVVLGAEVQSADVVGEELQIRRELLPQVERIPLAGLEQVLTVGPIPWTSDALGKLLHAEVPVQLLSASGWPLGELRPEDADLEHPEVLLAQADAVRNPTIALGIARVLVRAKIRNFATLWEALDAESTEVPQRLRAWANDAEQAQSLESLRGVEGAAAAHWYRHWRRFLGRGFSFPGRVAPDASDPVNVMLNIAHSQWYRQARAAARMAGLSPGLGFLHSSDRRYASLAADLQEPFRHVVERAVLQATRMLKRSQFVERSDGPHKLHLEHRAGLRFHALLQRSLLVGVVARGQTEPRAWIHQLLATARSLRRHLLSPQTPFEAFEHA
ncbi:CRISPR-associated endonuclease Cas1 [Tuwongella immobilis]|uniref:CRISPR-associated endonuclease Cas1 n=1 Tax=Tuwongella immobilis TaxID=692036 RepID=A0A6C2YSZ1_9BACT|nr:CRISPR-associated endonuclease Cas1 [Tuwongella immobilis]VIP04002.1 crispr-associated protein cas1 : CRISPR-associated protein Cas1 OS=Pirellula staleyi (strain ATCC 27377 / DSM 6068 / ICPB 4128) GN=Psta_1137 PE=3 SV=1: DUF2276: RVT_1: Cas_Cas1 [Tuwongella immobilis]VTS05371.1 crispr-associated protein cas1 : CRISPR-associated protein Cas1 OS=Pirellula staleyi (strain ATCC 27377 / DSM 6068 / ICPB 4128) GN=Psta_1137 PE=3 SV=1: DUF2276: RVT_1: Cas_Cas1 [Tuwongella immobilis]